MLPLPWWILGTGPEEDSDNEADTLDDDSEHCEVVGESAPSTPYSMFRTPSSMVRKWHCRTELNLFYSRSPKLAMNCRKLLIFQLSWVLLKDVLLRNSRFQHLRKFVKPKSGIVLLETKQRSWTKLWMQKVLETSIRLSGKSTLFLCKSYFYF